MSRCGEGRAGTRQAPRIAMEYSPLNAIPYVSYVDAGTKELVEQLGIELGGKC